MKHLCSANRHGALPDDRHWLLGLRVVAEVQSLENPFFSEDVRVLLGVDLSMARGASRFGLDRGGWLR